MAWLGACGRIGVSAGRVESIGYLIIVGPDQLQLIKML
jgi:hypothetical protein